VRRGIQVDPVGVAHRCHAARVEAVGAESGRSLAVVPCEAPRFLSPPREELRELAELSERRRATSSVPAAFRRVRPRCA